MNSNNRGQVGIILVFLILMVVAIVAISMTRQVRIDRQATANYSDALKARYLAIAGLERAIATLQADANHYDDLYEPWAQGFWCPLGDGDCLVGRTPEGSFHQGTGIRDEAGRLNVNVAGAESRFPASSPFGLDLTAIEQVGSARAAAILAYRHGQDGAPGREGIDDDEDRQLIETDRLDNDGDGRIDEEGEGVDEMDEFRVQRPVGDDNPFDTMLELRRVAGIGEGTFSAVRPSVTVFSYDTNVRQSGEERTNLNHAGPAALQRACISDGFSKRQAAQLAANIIDFRDADDTPTEVGGLLGVEKTPYINEVMPFFTTSTGASVAELLKGGLAYAKDRIGQRLTRTIRSKSKGRPNAARIVEAAISAGEDELEQALRSVGEEARDTDGAARVNLRSNCGLCALLLARPAHAKGAKKMEIEVEWVELYNPYDTACHLQGWQLRSSLGTKQLTGKIRPGGYRVVFNVVITVDGKRSGEEWLDNGTDALELVDADEHCADRATYANYGVPWRAWEKNDPRVHRFAGYMPGGSPWQENWYYMPDVGEVRARQAASSFQVRNAPFLTAGDIGYIHTGRQWRTVSLDKGGDWSLLDVFTTVWPVERRVPGRININTASRQVLQALPGIEAKLAEQVVRYGDGRGAPFDSRGEIAEVIGMQALGSNRWDDDGDGFTDEDDEVEALVRAVVNSITVRSNCFTITAVGRVQRGRRVVAESKVQAIIDRGVSPTRTLYYRILYERAEPPA